MRPDSRDAVPLSHDSNEDTRQVPPRVCLSPSIVTFAHLNTMKPIGVVLQVLHGPPALQCSLVKHIPQCWNWAGLISSLPSAYTT